MLDRRPRGSTVVREGPSRAPAWLAEALSEVRQDLTFRAPRRRSPYRRPPSPLLRRVVPALAVALVAVVSADLMVLGDLEAHSPATPRTSVARPGTGPAAKPGYVAATGTLPPSASPAPVAPLTTARKPHLFVVAPRELSDDAVRAVKSRPGVGAVEVVGAADVMMGGKRVQTMGVDPSTFRAYTPKSTASSDPLWNGVAAGDVAVSFTLGNDGGVPLGSTLDAGSRKLRVGAYATMGMGLINAVVSRDTARALGMPERNALVISAPDADSRTLRQRLLKALPKGTQVALINPTLPTPVQQRRNWPTGSFMTPDQVQTALAAAVSKLGRPYVWGAEGPDTFDCSGLVQWAFAQAGVRMPRVTHQQWVTGPQIPLSQAQPGDLLFWRNDPTNPGYISHVAIFWGNGKMLHAPRTGDVVKIAPLNTRNLAGVVRVSPWAASQAR
ncbi:C40 family peptidase [Sphaerisporangium rubeum]|uniref:Cell wall-associated NlpC family hydrolase n=1 Tax=Sphaerisporangium rubeum TaxID=321317 RepID=A0A7X0IJF4_9ACTN|nr:cell wall-associated NlpC family hydrolase [Sphaerisporangium rubeum]